MGTGRRFGARLAHGPRLLLQPRHGTTEAPSARAFLSVASFFALLLTPARAGNGLVERDREGTSEDEIKPIDWLVPVG